jgi:hypothetical protein
VNETGPVETLFKLFVFGHMRDFFRSFFKVEQSTFGHGLLQDLLVHS